MWTVQQYLTKPNAVLRCSLCGVERMGNYSQAKMGLLRCWTCRPKPPKGPRKRSPKKKKTLVRLADDRIVWNEAASSPAKLPPVRKIPAHKPTPPPPPPPPRIPGQVASRPNSYIRAVRYQIEEDAEEKAQHGRIEIVGLRTRNPLNKRLTWQAAKTFAEAAKKATYAALERSMRRPLEGHYYSYEVKLSRVSTKRALDDDGVAAALKAVRDAFAVFVRINDGNRAYLRVTYGTGYARVQGVVIEWTRAEGPFADEGQESFLFFDREELDDIAREHYVTRRYWKERMAKRLLSIGSRPAPVSEGEGDEQGEEAAYDVAEDEDEGERPAPEESDDDG